MRIVIIYDSLYGNTKKIAEAIATSSKNNIVSLLDAKSVSSNNLKDIDLLIIGSPTHGGRPMEETHKFIKNIPDGFLKGLKFAVFDTRILPDEQNIALNLLMKIIGFAAPKMAESLKTKGGKIVIPPEGFIVEGKEGPLKDGEIERAKLWAREIIRKCGK